MDKFAFIGYPLSLDLLYSYEIGFRGHSKELVHKIMEWTSPFKAAKITGIQSITGKKIDGVFIMCFLMPEQILNNSSQSIQRIIESAQLAESMGAQIIGLGGLTSIVGGYGKKVAKNLKKASVTTGNSYTAAITIEAIVKAAELMEIELKKAKVVIVGATGSIGAVCSQYFAEVVPNLVLVARNRNRLNKFADSIRNSSDAVVDIGLDVQQIVRDADIVVFATSTPACLVNDKIFKPGAIVCDVSVPRNVSCSGNQPRDDVLIIDGGLVRPPGNMKIEFDIGLPPGIAYACLCETMILCLEKRFENYSLGLGLSLDKVKEVAALGKKHGFYLSEFKSFGRPISVEKVKKAIKKTNKR